MLILIVGLVVFLGVHSLRIIDEGLRQRFIAERGQGVYKGLYSLFSALGLALIVVGYAQTRSSPIYLWFPPLWLSHVAALLMLVSFILLASAYVPGTHVKARVGHPMVLAVKLWALAHLLANGRLGELILFGAFLLWAIVNYASSRRRDRRDGVVYQAAGGPVRDLFASAAGAFAWIAFALWLHLPLIGVSPFGA